ncbi:MAG: Hsp70 family protein [Limisphaerales bacterium]|tara:strand:+ start:8794 stop:10704 length:1911 start_codon:yes stop_codon:yes gene_type:complete
MSMIIGIDLGTTHSAVAVVDAGFPLVLADQNGKRLTPSVVYFPNDHQEPQVGLDAVRMQTVAPARTIYSVKRFMGRRSDDLSDNEKRVDYSISQNPGQAIKILLKDDAFSPEQISAEILKSLKRTAELSMECSIERAVITVPAYFNDAQRQATIEAGRLAGLKVERIINEPTAAALAYGLDRLKDQSKIAVYDLGGGTFDITLLELSEGIFRVISTQGNTCLGGNDIDQAILDHFLNIVRKESSENIAAFKENSLPRLREAAEQAKIALSAETVVSVELPFLTHDYHFKTEFTRDQLEKIASPIVNRTRSHCIRALSDAGLVSSDLDQVVMVGGQTKMPLVRNRVSDYFQCADFEETRGDIRLGDSFHESTGPELNTNQNPDEAIALGAAIQGAMLSGQMNQMTLLDVTPLSLGIETFGGLMNVLIPRNSTIPVKAGEVFTTAVANQREMLIHTLQGEREKARDNWSLGRFVIPFEKAPKGVPRVGVQFEIDANGILHVLARDIQTGKEQHLEIRSAIDVDDSKVTEMVESSVEHAMDDFDARRWIETRLKAEDLLKAVKQSLEDCKEDIGPDYTAEIQQAVDALNKVLARENADKNTGDVDALKQAITLLDSSTQKLAEVQMDKITEQLMNQQHQ